MKSIAIIGAGIAGLVCARDLRRAGHSVRVFDKGRSPGGRTSTRRWGATSFDHGAPWLEVSSSAFRDELSGAVAAGALRQLRPELVTLRGGRVVKQLDNRWIFAGWPTMNRYAHHLAADVPVSAGLPVTELRRRPRPDGGLVWEVRRGEIVEEAPFDAVVLAVPAPQARGLLPADSSWGPRLAGVVMEPVLTALLAPATSLDVGWDGAEADDPVAARIVRRRAMGPRPDLADRPAPESWVIHGAPAFNRERLEQDPAASARELAAALAGLLGRPLPELLHLSGHRWRYARTASPLGEACLFDAERGLGVCGDWCLGDRVEDAWTSGRALAERLLAALGQAGPREVAAAWGVVH